MGSETSRWIQDSLFEADRPRLAGDRRQGRAASDTGFRLAVPARRGCSIRHQLAHSEIGSGVPARKKARNAISSKATNRIMPARTWSTPLGGLRFTRSSSQNGWFGWVRNLDAGISLTYRTLSTTHGISSYKESPAGDARLPWCSQQPQ
jgi:hypothetical protein